MASTVTMGLGWPLDIWVVEKVLLSTRPPLTTLQGRRGGGCWIGVEVRFSSGLYSHWRQELGLITVCWVSLVLAGYESPSSLVGLL